MKQIILSLTAVLVAASAFSQGTVNFSTRGGGVDAQVMYEGDPVRPQGPAGNEFWGQLYTSTGTGPGAALGSAVEFRNDAGIGYITGGGTVTIPGISPGGASGPLVLVAWHKSLGSDYTAAVAAGLGGVGSSAAFTIPATGNPTTSPPGVPVALTGLTGFQVSTLVPEPSIAVLGLLGAGLLLIRRKK